MKGAAKRDRHRAAAEPARFDHPGLKAGAGDRGFEARTGGARVDDDVAFHRRLARRREPGAKRPRHILTVGIGIDRRHFGAGNARGKECRQGADNTAAHHRDAIPRRDARIPDHVQRRLHVSGKNGPFGRHARRNRHDRPGGHDVAVLMRIEAEYRAPGHRPEFDHADIRIAVLYGRGESALLEWRAHALALAIRHAAGQHDELGAAAYPRIQRSHSHIFPPRLIEPGPAQGHGSRTRDPESSCFNHDGLQHAQERGITADDVVIEHATKMQAEQGKDRIAQHDMDAHQDGCEARILSDRTRDWQKPEPL